MAKIKGHSRADHLLHSHPCQRHRARAPVPRHRDHCLKTVLLMTYICAKTYLATLGQIQDQCLMPRRMSRCLQQAHRAVIEEIAIPLQFNHVEFSDIVEIILAVDWLSPRVRPERVANFLALHHMSGLWEI